MLRRILAGLSTHERRLTPVILVAVFIAGVLYSVRLGEVMRFPDEVEYVTLARSLGERAEFSFEPGVITASRPPGYPILLAAPMRLGGPILCRVLNMAFLVSSAWILARLARGYAGPIAALLVAASPVLYPVLFFAAGTLYSQTFATWLLVMVVWCLVAGQESVWRAIWAGLAAGWMVLTMPLLMIVLPGGMVAPFLLRRARPLMIAGVFLLAALVVLGSWSVRNRVGLGEWAFVSTNGGLNLLLGNSENTTPNAGVNVDLSRYFKESQERRLSEAEADRFYRDSAVRWVRTNPGQAASLYLRKLANHFNYRNELSTRSQSSSLRDLVMLASFGILALLTVVRLFQTRRWPLTGTEWIVLLLYLLGALFTAVFFTRIRFRVPYDQLLVLLAAAAVGWMTKTMRTGPQAEERASSEC